MQPVQFRQKTENDTLMPTFNFPFCLQSSDHKSGEEKHVYAFVGLLNEDKAEFGFCPGTTDFWNSYQVSSLSSLELLRFARRHPCYLTNQHWFNVSANEPKIRMSQEKVKQE